ncbi:uncharacterized protein LOC116269442 [Papio anubis]|uniref:uncharacterized protein LOC116269442 n=1 Tax=Papio anubis TaxID=9555 RepID=UPI0012AE9516|nr:uncharacterized protein LOC116269442 [Papio anubis]
MGGAEGFSFRRQIARRRVAVPTGVSEGLPPHPPTARWTVSTHVEGLPSPSSALAVNTGNPQEALRGRGDQFRVGEGKLNRTIYTNRACFLCEDWPGLYSSNQSLHNKGGTVEISHTHWLRGCGAMEGFKSRVSGIIFSPRAVGVPEVAHVQGRAAVLPPLPFALSLPLGGCGHCARREAVVASNAWETPLGGHYGAGSTLGGAREPEGEAEVALSMGRASFWAAPAWAGRGTVCPG